VNRKYGLCRSSFTRWLFNKAEEQKKKKKERRQAKLKNNTGAFRGHQ
jgi:hypothetical protein